MTGPRGGDRDRRLRRAKLLAYGLAVLVAAGVIALITWRLFARPY